jgi:hypothetical protein
MTIIVILVLAGAVAAIWAIQTAVGTATNAASRQVFKKSHQRGRSEMARTLTFTAPVSAGVLEQKIVDRVNAHPSAPALAGGLYLYQRQPGFLVFAVGNKMGYSMRARVDLNEANEGTSGKFEVSDWKESGAVVMAHTYVAKLIDRIQLAVADVSGTSVEA